MYFRLFHEFQLHIFTSGCNMRLHFRPPSGGNVRLFKMAASKEKKNATIAGKIYLLFFLTSDVKASVDWIETR